MKTIVVERQTRNGDLQTICIENVVNVVKAQNQTLRGFPKPQIVIWAKRTASSAYPIVFPTIEQRDQAFTMIKTEPSGAIVLDFNEYFCNIVIPNIRVKDFVNIKVSNHIRACARAIMQRESIPLLELLTRDAFQIFDYNDLQYLFEGHLIDKEITNETVRIWSKTLHIPDSILRLGVTPLQFFSTIVENEKTFNNIVFM